jgi:hypothetical protein
MNSAARKAELEIEGTLRVVPRRYWFAPITWVLPSSIPLAGTVTLHVKSWNDKVSCVQERWVERTEVKQGVEPGTAVRRGQGDENGFHDMASCTCVGRMCPEGSATRP